MTDYQILGIKRLQFLSYNDDEWRQRTGWRDLTFKDVVYNAKNEPDFWSLAEIEEMGKQIYERRTTVRTFRSNQQRKPQRRYCSKVSLGQQLSNKSHSLNKRDRGSAHVIRKSKNF